MALSIALIVTFFALVAAKRVSAAQTKAVARIQALPALPVASAGDHGGGIDASTGDVVSIQNLEDNNNLKSSTQNME